MAVKGKGQAAFWLGQPKNDGLEYEKNKQKLRKIEKNREGIVEISFTDVHNKQPGRRSLGWRGLPATAPSPRAAWF